MILTSILVLGILGFVFAGLLGLAANYFAVKEDKKAAEIFSVLPNVNCGACGAAGCKDFAEKVSKGLLPVNGCVVGGIEVANKVALLMGKEAEEIHKKVSIVHCGAICNQRKTKAVYQGAKTCKTANHIDGAGLLCSFGCIGYGDCLKACKFDAIKMVDGLPKIDPEKCTSCKKCIAACPRNIISLRPYDFNL